MPINYHHALHLLCLFRCSKLRFEITEKKCLNMRHPAVLLHIYISTYTLHRPCSRESFPCSSQIMWHVSTLMTLSVRGLNCTEVLVSETATPIHCSNCHANSSKTRSKLCPCLQRLNPWLRFATKVYSLSSNQAQMAQQVRLLLTFEFPANPPVIIPTFQAIVAWLHTICTGKMSSKYSTWPHTKT